VNYQVLNQKEMTSRCAAVTGSRLGGTGLVSHAAASCFSLLECPRSIKQSQVTKAWSR